MGLIPGGWAGCFSLCWRFLFLLLFFLGFTAALGSAPWGHPSRIA